MSIRKVLDGRAIGLMVLFCAIFGMQQVAIKAATHDIDPIVQMAIRSGVAAFIIGIFLHMKGLPLLPQNGKGLAGLAAGILFTLEYFFVAEGLRFTHAARMVIMLYTAPAFAALCLHFLIPEERLHPMQWVGMALAFCGVTLAFYDAGGSPERVSGSILRGDFLGLLAGMSWGATTVIIRTKLSETPPAATTFIQLLTCFCVLLPGAVLGDRLHFTLSTTVWISLTFQILIVCVFGMLLWFWLLTVYSASQLGVLSFLTPVFGIVFGVLLLGESVAPRFILGAALVVAGIILVSGWKRFLRYAWPRRKAAAP
jgi:drug/metabolite transporter (DMT)-like permease